MGQGIRALLLLLSLLECLHGSATAIMSVAEQRFRSALTDPQVTSFELMDNIRLTAHLPGIVTSGPSGPREVLRIFSKTVRFTLDGASKYHGLYMVFDGEASMDLMLENIGMKNFNSTSSPEEIERNSFAGPGRGAAVTYIGNGTVSVRDCNFFNNKAAENGGAIFMGTHYDPVNDITYLNGGTLTVKRSRFFNNRAVEGGGGAICIQQGNRLTVEGSHIRYNSAGQSGGGIEILMPTAVRIVQSTLLGNKAKYAGGAMTVNFYHGAGGSNPVHIRNTVVSFNSVSNDDDSTAVTPVGGAFAFSDVPSINLCRTRFSNNTLVAKGKTTPSNVWIEVFERTVVKASPSTLIPFLDTALVDSELSKFRVMGGGCKRL